MEPTNNSTRQQRRADFRKTLRASLNKEDRRRLSRMLHSSNKNNRSLAKMIRAQVVHNTMTGNQRHE